MVVDTIGACGPEAVELLVRQVCQWVGPDVPVHYHGHNDFGMATACAVAAVRAGASWIQGTINGMGERAGNADIGEIALALRCLYDVPVALDLTKVREVSEVVSRASGYTLEAWKPLVGENLFMRESGAVASQFHIPEAIEPYSSELVNAKRTHRPGKEEWAGQHRSEMPELGIVITAESRGAILAAVKKRAIAKRGLVTDEEFREIVAEHSVITSPGGKNQLPAYLLKCGSTASPNNFACSGTIVPPDFQHDVGAARIAIFFDALNAFFRRTRDGTSFSQNVIGDGPGRGSSSTAFHGIGDRLEFVEGQSRHSQQHVGRSLECSGLCWPDTWRPVRERLLCP